MNKALDDASEKTRIAGDALLSLQDPSADMAAVRTQMDALSSRVHALKGKMTRFEEHYDEHMRKATEFQLAVEQLLAKFAGRKEQLLAVEVDTTDGQAIKKRIEELEVSFVNFGGEFSRYSLWPCWVVDQRIICLVRNIQRLKKENTSFCASK